MKQRLKTRELITLDGSDVDLSGTYHRASHAAGLDADPEAETRGRIGIIFVNALSTPRAGYSDSAVYWADSFAASGYPCFRFDLPGLGDSRGEVAPELLTFITDGGYASVIGHKLKELAARYHLAGVIVAGHCAGSVTALYAASDHKCCKGLILMDPYFNYPKRLAPKVPEKLVVWSRRTRLGSVARRTYDQVRDLSRTMRPDGLPGSTNFALLAQWKHVTSSGLPVLVLTSPGLEPRAGQFDYISHASKIASRHAEITLRSIADTDHSFANAAGRTAVRQHVGAWLMQQFPVSAAYADARSVKAVTRLPDPSLQGEHVV